jgi:hypothetical protein
MGRRRLLRFMVLRLGVNVTEGTEAGEIAGADNDMVNHEWRLDKT